MRRANGLDRLQQASCGLALAALLAGAMPSAASAHAAKGHDTPLNMKTMLKWGLKRAPTLTPVALAQVKGKPIFLQFAYLEGAVDGYQNTTACIGLALGDRNFVAKRLMVLADKRASFLQGSAFSPALVVATYLDGATFACTYFG
jgi:hypothetical protein